MINRQTARNCPGLTEIAVRDLLKCLSGTYRNHCPGLTETRSLVQYINPTLQFVVAVAVFSEPFSAWQVVSFALIWIALALYSASSVSIERVARKARASSSTVSTTVMNPVSDGSAKP